MRKNLIESINQALRIMLLNENNPITQSAPDNTLDDETPKPKPLPDDWVEYNDPDSPTNRWLRRAFPLTHHWRRMPPSIPGYSNPTLNDDLEWVIYDSNGNLLFIWDPRKSNGYGGRGMWVPYET